MVSLVDFQRSFLLFQSGEYPTRVFLPFFSPGFCPLVFFVSFNSSIQNLCFGVWFWRQKCLLSSLTVLLRALHCGKPCSVSFLCPQPSLLPFLLTFFTNSCLFDLFQVSISCFLSLESSWPNCSSCSFAAGSSSVLGAAI